MQDAGRAEYNNFKCMKDEEVKEEVIKEKGGE